MRKSVFLVLALLLIIGGFVFAQDMSKPSVAITAWGRGIFLPVIGGGNDMNAVVGVSWGGNTRVGYTVAGNSDNVGFQVDLTNDGTGGPGFGDQQKIWFKPISQIEVQIGRIYDDTLRGSASYGAWNWQRYNFMSGDGDIFWRVGEAGEAAFELSITPVDGAYIYAGLGGNGLSIFPPSGGAVATTTADMMKWGQYGAGYTIQNIGTIRAQYIGLGDNGTINAAFKLSAVPGLTVDVGGFIPTLSGADTIVAGYVSYAMDALTVNAMGRFGFATGKSAIEAGAGVDYTLDKANNIAVTADFRFANADAASGNSAIGILVGLTKGFSNGVIGIGFEGTTGDFAGSSSVNTTAPLLATTWSGKTVADVTANATAFVWTIPIRMEYFF